MLNKIITINGVTFCEGDEIEYYINVTPKYKGDLKKGKLVWNQIGYVVDERKGYIDEFQWHLYNPIKTKSGNECNHKKENGQFDISHDSFEEMRSAEMHCNICGKCGSKKELQSSK